MGRADFWQRGSWNMICQVCGFKYKNTDMKLRWDNIWCCPEDWEVRQPQDFVRGIKDQMSVPYAVPEPPDHFIGDQYLQDSSGNIIYDQPQGNPILTKES